MHAQGETKPSLERIDNVKGLHRAITLPSTFLVHVKHAIKYALIFLSKHFPREQLPLSLSAHKHQQMGLCLWQER